MHFFVSISAFVSITISIATLIGWYFQIPSLVQLTPDLAPLHFNAAVCFLLSGLALSCCFFDLYLPLVCFLGLTIFAIGGITSLQYFFSFKSGLDEFFINDFLFERTSAPGRMSVNTAVSFTFEGLSLLLLLIKSKEKWAYLLSIILSSLILAIGALSSIGYVIGLETTYAWGNWSFMSPQSAILFTFQGLTLLFIAESKLRKLAPTDATYAYPVSIAIIIFSLFGLLSQAIEKERTQQIIRTTQTEAVEFASVMQLMYRNHIAMVKRISDHLEKKEAWVLTNNYSIETLDDIKSIAVLSPKLDWQWIYQRNDIDETLLRDLPKNPNCQLSIHEAIRSQTPVIYPLFIKTDDTPQFLIFYPAIKNKVLQATFLLVVDMDVFLKNTLKNRSNNRYFIDIFYYDKQLFSWDPPADTPAKYKSEYLFEFENIKLLIQARPGIQYLKDTRLSHIGAYIFIAGLLIGIFAALYIRSYIQLRISLKEVKANEERFQLATKATSDIICDWDYIHDKIKISDNIRMLGYTAEDTDLFTREWWISHVHPDDREKVSTVEAKAIKNRSTHWSLEYSFSRADGTYIDVIDRAWLLYDDEGNPYRIIGAVMDITERKNIERMKNEFISIISHELRTPLTSIKGSLGLLLNRNAGELTDKAKALLNICASNCDRLIRLINDILDVEKIEANKIEFNMQAIDLAELIWASHAANMAYSKNGTSIVIQDIPSSSIVTGDYDRLRQVLDNLLSNAFKFSPSNGKIYVSVEKKEGSYRVSVRDEGPGIPIEFQGRIFQKFAQADSSSSRAKAGTGLGLNISKAIVERHGGSIGFTTGSSGTTFYFDLPALQTPSTNVAVAKDLAYQSMLKVLICEEDKEIAFQLQTLLQKENCLVDIATTITDTKNLLTSKRYDILFVDSILPDGDGIIFTKELKSDSRNKNLAIIILAGSRTKDEIEIPPKNSSIVEVLEMPFKHESLQKVIQKIQEQASSANPIKVLHIEDDPDILTLVKTLLSKEGSIEQATTIREAMSKLNDIDVDLVLLDIGLPDGSGLSLLPFINKRTNQIIPTVVFSAHEVPKEKLHFISYSLLKSATTNEKLLSIVRSVAKQN